MKNNFVSFQAEAVYSKQGISTITKDITSSVIKAMTEYEHSTQLIIANQEQDHFLKSLHIINMETNQKMEVPLFITAHELRTLLQESDDNRCCSFFFQILLGVSFFLFWWYFPVFFAR